MALGIMMGASIPSKQPESWSLVACYQKRGGHGMLDAWQWCVQHGRADKTIHCTLNFLVIRNCKVIITYSQSHRVCMQ